MEGKGPGTYTPHGFPSWGLEAPRPWQPKVGTPCVPHDSKPFPWWQGGVRRAPWQPGPAQDWFRGSDPLLGGHLPLLPWSPGHSHLRSRAGYRRPLVAMRGQCRP